MEAATRNIPSCFICYEEINLHGKNIAFYEKSEAVLMSALALLHQVREPRTVKPDQRRGLPNPR